jgi:hypothetical protein
LRRPAQRDGTTVKGLVLASVAPSLDCVAPAALERAAGQAGPRGAGGGLGWCGASTEVRRTRRAAATAPTICRGRLGRSLRRCSATSRDLSVTWAARNPLRLLERRSGAGALCRRRTSFKLWRPPSGVRTDRWKQEAAPRVRLGGRGSALAVPGRSPAGENQRFAAVELLSLH